MCRRSFPAGNVLRATSERTGLLCGCLKGGNEPLGGLRLFGASLSARLVLSLLTGLLKHFAGRFHFVWVHSRPFALSSPFLAPTAPWQ